MAPREGHGRPSQSSVAIPSKPAIARDSKLAKKIGQDLSHIAKALSDQILDIKSATRDVTIFLNTQLTGKRSSTIATGAGNNTLSQWEAVQTAYTKAVNELRGALGDGIIAIADLHIILKYLATSTDSVDKKLSQLRQHTEFLASKADRAKAAITGLQDVLDCVKRFQRHWPVGDTVYTKEIAPRVNVIVTKINGLLQKRISDQANTTEGCNTIGLTKTLILLLTPTTASEFRSITEVDGHAKLEEIGRRSTKELQTFNVLDNLINVGRLLGEDMQAIEDSFRHGRDGVRNRILNLIALYECLSNGLSDMKSILNSTPVQQKSRNSGQQGSGNFLTRIWRKLFGH